MVTNMALIAPLFLCSFCLLFTKGICLQSCQPFQIKAENLNKQLLGYKLFDMKVLSHHECAKECMFIGACVSINFDTSTKTCEINSSGSETVNPSDFYEVKGTIFSDISEWPQSMVGGCKHHQCDKRQRCSPVGNGAYKCVNITCDHTRHVNGDDQSGTSIAGTNTSYVITCPENMFHSGDTSITCLLNGEWSVPEATCIATTIGTTCTSNSDCNESEAICNQGYCFCNRFYRYDPDSKDCMKVCTALTDLFSLTKGMRVLGFNDRGISPQTLADCKTQCIEDTDCMSFEYNTDSGRCRRSSLSKRMVQDALPDFILFDTEFVDFYDRDCL